MGFLPNNSTGFRSMSSMRGGFRNQAGSAGCTNPIAMNFDPSASEDDGSCQFAMGCTLPMALNYDPSAVLDDGSCAGDLFFPNMGGVVPSSYLEYMELYNAGIDAQAGTGYGAEVNPLVYGCSNPNAVNFDPNVEADDGSCIFPPVDYGIGESGGGASSSDGIYIGGCLNYEAQNFNPNANYDDGSCLFQEGCTDPLAYNYDPTAPVDDGSCQYPTSGGNDPVGPTGPNVGDLLDQLAADAGGSSSTTSSGNSGGMLTDSGASYAKDPKGKRSKKPKKKFSGFAGRDAEGFFIGASPSQPYVGASGGRMCSCAGCGHINIDADPFTGMGQLACARCCKGQQSGFRGACGCGA